MYQKELKAALVSSAIVFAPMSALADSKQDIPLSNLTPKCCEAPPRDEVQFPPEPDSVESNRDMIQIVPSSKYNDGFPNGIRTFGREGDTTFSGEAHGYNNDHYEFRGDMRTPNPLTE